MSFTNAFQTNAFQQNAFQIVAGAIRHYTDYGFYGTEEDDQLKRLLQQIAEERRKIKAAEAENRQDIQRAAHEAYHYVPPGPPLPAPKLPRPPFAPPPAGPIHPWGLAQRLARAPVTELAAPQVAPPPDPLEEMMQQAMAQVDAINVDGILDQAMAQIDAIDIDAMLANDPEYQRMMQLLERL